VPVNLCGTLAIEGTRGKEDHVTTGKKCVLAIDLGTSGAKVALVSIYGQVLDYEFEKTHLFLLPNGGAEQSPDDWWDAIKKALGRLLAKRAVAPDDVIALSCTAQWSGTVAVDREGHHLMNAIIWMDARGAPHVQRITDGFVKIEGYGIWKLLKWIRLTGGIPGRAGKDSIAHILYIKHARPEIYEQTYKFLEPKDYLNLRLTGQFAASCDSIALHWLTDNRDIANVVYDDSLLKMSTVEREKLPDLKQAVDVLGPLKPEVARELGLGEDVKVVIGTPDVHSAAIGSGAVKDYAGHLYIGTSSWLACHVPFKKTDVLHNIASLPSAIPGSYLVANEQQTAGACLTFLRDNVLYRQDELAQKRQPDQVYKIFDRIAAQTSAGSDRVIFTPWLYGERTPVGDRAVRGGFHNLSLQTTRAHLIRAVFEGVAYNARWLLGYVEKFIKRRFDILHLIGGGANSDVWCQIYADVLGRTIRQVQDPLLANVRGAAFLALVALGHLTFDDVSERVQIAHTYVPNSENRKVYDELFAEYVNIYKRNRRMYARLNKVG
jgi:xylulokinase